MIVCDTGPLVAAADRDDRHNRACTDLLTGLHLARRTILVPAPVIAEVLSGSAPSAGRSWSQSGTRRELRQLKHRGDDEVRIVPCPTELTALLRHRARDDSGGPAVSRRARRPALGEHVLPDLGAGSCEGAHPGGGCFSPGPPALRPAARGSVDAAQRRRPSTPGHRLGRAQCRRTPTGVREVRRRPGGRLAATGGGDSPRMGADQDQAACRPWIPVESRTEWNTSRQRKTGPCPHFRWSRDGFGWCGG